MYPSSGSQKDSRSPPTRRSSSSTSGSRYQAPSIREPHIDLHPRLYINAVYYPNYRIYRGEKPSDLNFGLISHVFYAFAWIRENGEVYLSDEWGDTQLAVDGAQGCLGSFTALKKEHAHLKVILSIGGAGKGSENFPQVAAVPVKRDTFALSCSALVRRYDLDGIDIDWEHPSTSHDGVHFSLLLSTLRKYLPLSRFLLTAALPAGAWALQYINFAVAIQHLDYINLMAYDFTGPWHPTTGHHAQLFSSDYPNEQTTQPSGHSAVTYLIAAGVPSSKIVLGIPAYGRSFLHTNNINQLNVGSGGEDGVFEYKELPRPGSVEYVDTAVAAAFCVGNDGGFVTYDNPVTAKLKAEYVKATNLGGVFFWTGTADFPSGSRSLTQATFTALHAEYQ